MYNTVKELHIALDERLQQLNSNRKLVLYPEQKDARLNEAVMQYINNVVSSKLNVKKEGFEDTQKRYDDIEELIRTITLSIYINESDNVIAPLPYDYLHLINDRSILSYNCDGLSYTSQASVKAVTIIPFTADTAVAAPFYNSFKININGSAIFTSPLTIKSVESRFMIINCVLETLNSAGVYEIYWEYYLDHYEKNSFIIVKTPTVVTTATITYGVTTINGTLSTYSYTTYGIGQTFPNSVKRSNALCSHEDVYDMLDNYYYNKNRHLKPISEIQRGFLKVFYNSTFIIKEVQIDYIKRPRLINLALNQSCELNCGEEIVAIAVQNIMADKTNDYTTFATERMIKE